MTLAGTPLPKPPHPVAFDVVYPQRLSRVTTFFRLLLAIPQLIAIYLLMIAMSLLTILAWFAILFTGRYPKAFFDFTSGVLRWQANVYAYVALLRDEYPPFSWEPGAYPLTLEIPSTERQSRLRLFIRWIALIPNHVVFWFVQIAWFFTSFMAWCIILVTGRYPRGLFNFAVGAIRWQLRSTAYQSLLRDEYPPYSINATARPGNELVSFIVGVPLFVAYVALSIMPLFGLFDGNTIVRATLSSTAIHRDHPSARSGSLRITLLDYNNGAAGATRPGTRMVSFDIKAEKDGRWPAFFTPYLFSTDLCDGEYTSGIEDVSDETTSFDIYWRGGSDTATVYFLIPSSATICELRYFGGRGVIRFRSR